MIPQMITINGTLGAGLYIRSGQILQLAGPVAVIIPFLVLCILAWWVMSCITELLCLWPVPGALPLFVTKFVDQELGHVVAIAYWYTYSVGFAALVAICASTITYWMPNMALAGHVTCYCLLPFILGGVNSLEVGLYGWIEAVTGIIKLIMLVVVIIVLVVIDCRSKMPDELKTEWQQPTVYDKDAATSFGQAFIMAFPIATFAFTGVEIIAVSIIEARWQGTPEDSNSSQNTAVSKDNRSPQDIQCAQEIQNRPSTLAQPNTAHNSRSAEESTGNSNPQVMQDDQVSQDRPLRSDDGRDAAERSWGPQEAAITTTIKSMAAVIPIIIGVAYVLSGALVAIGLSRSDPALPRLSWIENSTSTASSTSDSTSTATETSNDSIKSISSPFTLIAAKSDINYLEHVFNAFILFTALTCANTNLYVASRVLFGIATNIRASSGLLKHLARFGVTYTNGVPLLAVWTSIFFCWVPFIEIPGGFETGSSFEWAVEILTESASVSVIIVWMCQCWAYIRYHDYVETYKATLQNSSLHPVLDDIYPYRSYGQPFLAWVALILCILVLVVFNSAFLWKGFYLVPFLMGYIPIFAFIFIWLCLKVRNGKLPRFTKLKKAGVVAVFKDLKDLRDGSLAPPKNPNPPPDGA
ncbi:hypothetical protein FOBRF1_001663 [Fusarium oxysporum]